MLHPSTIQLLRFHFSFFLLPVFLFALSQVGDIHWMKAGLAFFILHLLVYPSSNGYNSYMDKDQSPIGGLASPLLPTKELFYFSVGMDVVALVLSFLLSPVFGLGIVLYILASRAYSYRGIRLKKFPIIGFLTVFIFQGALIFFITYAVTGKVNTLHVPPLPCFIASLLIGALYPLTQVYQHQEDKKDGVTTISMLLGKRGSFVFSMLQFLSATVGFYFLFHQQHKSGFFLIYLLSLLPVVLFFLYWMGKVWQHEQAANFTNSLRMNRLSTVCTTIFFLILLIFNH